MGTVPTILLTAAGAVLIAAALRDVFDVLFHEMGTAVLSHVVIRAVWRAFRALGRRRAALFTLAGPMALIAVVASWVLLLIVGWALVYWPHMPDGFTFGQGVGTVGAFADSLYVSMVTLSTVGYGDVAPDAVVLRLVSPLEALLGLGLLTASISWLLSIYPVLSRRRSLAYEINLLTESEREIGKSVLELGAGSAEAIYSELTSRLVAVERDLATLPVAYYFSEHDERFSLPAQMPALLDLADRGVDDSLPARVRLRAAMLRQAIDDFLGTAAEGFHGEEDGSTKDLLETYRDDHLR
jgi:hypothetical protein